MTMYLVPYRPAQRAQRAGYARPYALALCVTTKVNA
jgi:hypothetical protein